MVLYLHVDIEGGGASSSVEIISNVIHLKQTMNRSLKLVVLNEQNKHNVTSKLLNDCYSLFCTQKNARIWIEKKKKK